MQDQIQRLHSQIDDSFEDHLRRTRDFVRQPSISGDGTGIREMAQLVAGEVERLGGQAEIVPTPGHPVVTGEVDAGAPRTLLVYGMYDVQPVSGETWTTEPFGAEIIELPGVGRSLLNRGITNQKGPLIGFFCAMQSLLATAGSLPVNLKFLVEGEEELGSPSLPGVVERQREALAADAALFPAFSQDPNGKVVMYLGAKGTVHFEVTARGGDWGGPTSRGIHGSNAAWFHSPAWALVQALAGMLSVDQRRIAVPGIYDDVAPPSVEDEELLARLCETLTLDTYLRQNDVRRFKHPEQGADLLRRYLFEPGLNLNGIASGYVGPGTKTVVPHEARARVDIRLVPQMQPETVFSLMRDYLGQAEYHVEAELLHAYTWSKSSVTDQANSVLLETYRSLGFEPEVWPLIAGSAPFYLFTQRLGIPVAMGGLGHGGRQHSPDEYASVDGLRLFEKSVAEYVLRFGARSQPT
jgi:acetylornithine deacetylase/succinyl-diaminopimelate desuccinylase-like protein